MKFPLKSKRRKFNLTLLKFFENLMEFFDLFKFYIQIGKILITLNREIT